MIDKLTMNWKGYGMKGHLTLNIQLLYSIAYYYYYYYYVPKYLIFKL